MRILFIFPRPKPYDSQSVREKPSGGTEKCVVFLSEALGLKGHTCHIVTTEQTLKDVKESKEPYDVVVTQEAEWLTWFPSARKIWWTHHFSDQPIIQRNAAFGRCYADEVVTLSACHQQDFKEHLRLDTTVIGHGVWLDEVKTAPKRRYSYIYASTPFRGLDRLPEIFAGIKQREPEATLHICSSMRTYGDEQDDSPYRAVFDELAAMDGVILHGSLNQADLYQLYAETETFLYPSTWRETYCLAMDEAIAHGCKLQVEPLGALAERLHGYKVKDWRTIAEQWEILLNGT